jgi:hypothetical protein
MRQRLEADHAHGEEQLEATRYLWLAEEGTGGGACRRHQTQQKRNNNAIVVVGNI